MYVGIFIKDCYGWQKGREMNNILDKVIFYCEYEERFEKILENATSEEECCIILENLLEALRDAAVTVCKTRHYDLYGFEYDII